MAQQELEYEQSSSGKKQPAPELLKPGKGTHPDLGSLQLVDLIVDALQLITVRRPKEATTRQLRDLL